MRIAVAHGIFALTAALAASACSQVLPPVTAARTQLATDVACPADRADARLYDPPDATETTPVTTVEVAGCGARRLYKCTLHPPAYRFRGSTDCVAVPAPSLSIDACTNDFLAATSEAESARVREECGLP